MHIANAIHSLARHSSIIVWLVEIGVLKALSKLLELAGGPKPREIVPMVADALSALRIFAKTNNFIKMQGMVFQCHLEMVLSLY